MPLRSGDVLAIALALHAGVCAAAVLLAPGADALLASGVLAPFAVSWLVLTLDGTRNA